MAPRTNLKANIERVLSTKSNIPVYTPPNKDSSDRSHNPHNPPAKTPVQTFLKASIPSNTLFSADFHLSDEEDLIERSPDFIPKEKTPTTKIITASSSADAKKGVYYIFDPFS